MKIILPVGGKTIIDWIVGDTRPLAPTETIFITGYKAEVMDHYLAGKPEWGKTRTVLQSDPQGLGQAISLALPYTSDDEPLLIILGDTLFDADLGRLAGESENVLYTYKVQNPRRFSVAVTGENGRSLLPGAGSRGIKLRLYTAIFPPRGPSAVDKRPSRPFGRRSLTQGHSHYAA